MGEEGGRGIPTCPLRPVGFSKETGLGSDKSSCCNTGGGNNGGRVICSVLMWMCVGKRFVNGKDLIFRHPLLEILQQMNLI